MSENPSEKGRVAIEICPAHPRFAEELEHRDYLGALMNLGLTREVIGDVVVREQRAYCICEESVADYIKENFTQVRHTNIVCTILDDIPKDAQPDIDEEVIIVSSPRIDAIVSRAFGLARGKSKAMFQRKLIQINHQPCTNPSAIPREGDILSIRGHGRIVYRGIIGGTKKGNQRVLIGRYI